MRFLILFTIILCNASLVNAQKKQRYNEVKYDNKLDNILFHESKAFPDSVTNDSGKTYIQVYDNNTPVNSNCVSSMGELGPETIGACSCEIRNDTIYTLVTSSPGVIHSYSTLLLKIAKDKFTSDFSFSADILPEAHATTKYQYLLLKGKSSSIGDSLKGFLSYRGSGVSSFILPLDSNFTHFQTNKSRFHPKVQGYFKCKIQPYEKKNRY